MSISQIESKIKSLQTEIGRLNKQNATEAGKEAKAQEAIRRTQKSITKSTSLSSLKSKQRTIASETDKADKARKKQTEILEKIGKKKMELAKQQGLLQKEQDKAFKSLTDKHDSLIEAQRKLVSEAGAMQISNQEKEYDFFLSHAWEDKEAVAKPLADAMIERGAKVWIDKYQMTVGDSLRQSIDDGLAHSRYGIVKQQSLLQKEQDKAFKALTDQQNMMIASQQKIVSEAGAIQMSIQEKEYDFFISHAWEDKEAVAKPLADAMIERGAKVWIDKYQMTVGDSLRQSIDDGLAHSRYGIVILSETYFKKFWTGKELNGLFAKQEDRKKVILPVWHNISKDKVKEYSPILADMLALKTADFTIDELAEQFVSLIR